MIVAFSVVGPSPAPGRIRRRGGVRSSGTEAAAAGQITTPQLYRSKLVDWHFCTCETSEENPMVSGRKKERPWRRGAWTSPIWKNGERERKTTLQQFPYSIPWYLGSPNHLSFSPMYRGSWGFPTSPIRCWLLVPLSNVMKYCLNIDECDTGETILGNAGYEKNTGEKCYWESPTWINIGKLRDLLSRWMCVALDILVSLPCVRTFVVHARHRAIFQGMCTHSGTFSFRNSFELWTPYCHVKFVKNRLQENVRMYATKFELLHVTKIRNSF